MNRMAALRMFSILLLGALPGLSACAAEQSQPSQQEQVQTAEPQPNASAGICFIRRLRLASTTAHFVRPTPAFSLQNYMERDVSLTTTLFFGLRLEKNTVLVFQSGNRRRHGDSAASTGLANSSNGELPRVASATPKPYIARLYVSHDFALGHEMESVGSDENQLAGRRPVNRYTVTAGRFTLTDFFDNNRYSHDPRTQFMGGRSCTTAPGTILPTFAATPGDGFTSSTLRTGRFATPAPPCPGSRTACASTAGCSAIAAMSSKASGAGMPASIRAPSACLHYENRANAGTYAEALRQADVTGGAPDVTATRRNGTLKYGFGVNVEQEIADEIGVFARLGWNDGKTESFAFTAIDRLATGGISISGSRWHRPFDTVATEFTAGRDLWCSRALSRTGRPRFPDRRRTAAVRPETISEIVLQRPRAALAICEHRPSARLESRHTTRIVDRSGFLRCASTPNSGTPEHTRKR